jgi:uncharacterized RmlC-like cupin family protein
MGELKVIRSTDLSDTPGQTPGALRLSGISTSTTDARRIWFGRVHNDPGMRSVPHHHGEAETAGFVIKGQARIYYGDGYRQYVDMDEGDFIYVPAYFPHIEANRSQTEPLDFLTARTPDNIVINLSDQADIDPSKT